jgi:hypothetical protein
MTDSSAAAIPRYCEPDAAQCTLLKRTRRSLPSYLHDSGRTIETWEATATAEEIATLRAFYVRFFDARAERGNCYLVALSDPIAGVFWEIRRQLWPEVCWDAAALATPQCLPTHHGMMSLGSEDFDACIDHAGTTISPHV